MVSCVIKGYEIQDVDKILMADFEISDTRNFSNIVLSSYNDEVNKMGILFKDDLDPNKTYYGRCRVLLKDEGWVNYNNLDEVRVNLHGYMNQNEDLPSKISIPLLSTDSVNEYHANTLFTIKSDGYSVVGTARHTYTNYWITDLDTKEIVWSKMGRELEKKSTVLNDILLQDNKVYNINACFMSSTGDSSQVASMTIRVGGSGIELLTPPDTILPNRENFIKVKDMESASLEFTYEIILAGQKRLTSVYIEDGLENFTLPNGILEYGNIYILRIKSKKTGLIKDTILSTHL